MSDVCSSPHKLQRLEEASVEKPNVT